MDKLVSKIAHKAHQLRQAEEKMFLEYNKHNVDNYKSTRRALHDLALQLAKETEL